MNRLALTVFIAYALVPNPSARQGTWYCETDCGSSTSCDYQCIDGGSTTTCGEYNGGFGNGMCSGVPYCHYTITYSSAEREVPGPLDVECPGDWPHDPPFSNFGTSGPYHSVQDALQFAGWEAEGDGTLHWNACTSHPDYDPPNPFYYNVNSTSQDSSGEYAYAVRTYSVPGTCADQLAGGVYSNDYTWTTVYDLDGVGWFQQQVWVATLGYNTGDFLVSCNQQNDTCWGDSGFVTPIYAPSFLTGKIKVALSASGGMAWP